MPESGVGSCLPGSYAALRVAVAFLAAALRPAAGIHHLSADDGGSLEPEVGPAVIRVVDAFRLHDESDPEALFAHQTKPHLVRYALVRTAGPTAVVRSQDVVTCEAVQTPVLPVMSPALTTPFNVFQIAGGRHRHEGAT